MGWLAVLDNGINVEECISRAPCVIISSSSSFLAALACRCQHHRYSQVHEEPSPAYDKRSKRVNNCDVLVIRRSQHQNHER